MHSDIDKFYRFIGGKTVNDPIAGCTNFNAPALSDTPHSGDNEFPHGVRETDTLNNTGIIMKILLILACVFFTSNIYAAGCVTNARGKTVCANANTGNAAGYNPNTGNAVRAQTNSAGVTHTQTSGGGEAYTKNGKGVAQGPGGTTCVRTARNQGCK